MKDSEDELKDAYGRMDMDAHPWARHASAEVAAIEDLCGPLDGHNILDAGCGRGRHAIEIARRCPSSEVNGVDFSEENIRHAEGKGCDLDNLSFDVGDLRSFVPSRMYDVVLCLYDVIGSLPDEEDNRLILKNLASSCRSGGTLVVSVMNMELTERLAHPFNVGDIGTDPGILARLPVGDVMNRSGDVFDPLYYAIDRTSGLVYRKEAFGDTVYIVRDKRYHADEISALVSDSGFEPIDVRHVRAGRWNEPLDALDPKAKEILVIARRRRCHGRLNLGPSGTLSISWMNAHANRG